MIGIEEAVNLGPKVGRSTSTTRYRLYRKQLSNPIFACVNIGTNGLTGPRKIASIR